MVRGFNGAASRLTNAIRNTPGAPVWQRNYYQHVIRINNDYNRIAEYVANNPQRWIENSLHTIFLRATFLKSVHNLQAENNSQPELLPLRVGMHEPGRVDMPGSVEKQAA